MQLFRHIAPLLLATLAFAPAASSEEGKQALTMDLNAADTIGEACRLTFVLTNGLEADIDRLVYETVLFSNQGRVLLLTLFDFGSLPVGRPRVRQFQVPDTTCDRIGSVLINGADTCDGTGLAPGLCETALETRSLSGIEIGG